MWVLILVLHGVPATAEFTTKENCEYAIESLKYNLGPLYAKCLEK